MDTLERDYGIPRSAPNWRQRFRALYAGEFMQPEMWTAEAEDVENGHGNHIGQKLARLSASGYLDCTDYVTGKTWRQVACALVDLFPPQEPAGAL